MEKSRKFRECIFIEHDSIKRRAHELQSCIVCSLEVAHLV